MSRYRPVISIRTDLADPSKVAVVASGVPSYDAAVSRVENYSITPRTLKSVTEFHPDYVMASTVGGVSGSAAGSSYNPELYTSTEEYSYASQTVLRYAIRDDLIRPDADGTIFGKGRVVPKAPTGSVATCSPEVNSRI